jgi:hypothetical protein
MNRSVTVREAFETFRGVLTALMLGPGEPRPDLPMGLKIRLSALHRVLEPLVSQFEKEQQAILQRHARLDAEGNLVPLTRRVRKPGAVEGEMEEVDEPIPNTYLPKEGHEEALQAELEELFSAEVAVEAMPLQLERFAAALDERGVDLPVFAVHTLLPWSQEEPTPEPLAVSH